MRILTNFVAVAALLVASWMSGVASSDEPVNYRPVVTVAISRFDQVATNCRALRTSMQAGGETGALFEKLGLSAGLDQTRSAGLVVDTDGTGLRTLGFLPVSDRKEFVESLSQAWGELMDAGDGIVEIPAPLPIWAKIEDEWAFVSSAADTLLELPEDPVQLLDGLEKKYHVAVRAHIDNIPLVYRQLALGWLQFGVQDEMSQLDGLHDVQSRLRRKMMQDSLIQVQSLVNETSEISCGWVVDPVTNDMRFDLAVTAVEGTSSAERMAGIKESASNFAGFLLPESSIQLHFAADVPKNDVDRTSLVLNAMKSRALAELQHDPEITGPTARSDAQDVLGQLFDVVISSVEEGHIEGGVAVIFEDDSFSLVAGGHIINETDFEAGLRGFCELCAREDGFPDVAWNVAEYRGVRLHHWEVPIQHTELTTVLGDRLPITFGTGEQSGYLSIGSRSEDLLKRVLDQSHQMQGSLLPPGQMSISLSPIIRYLSNRKPGNEKLTALDDFLNELDGRDRITVTNSSMENGAFTQITLEQDVVKILAEWTSQNIDQMIQRVPPQLGVGAATGF